MAQEHIFNCYEMKIGYLMSKKRELRHACTHIRPLHMRADELRTGP
jgi:hypothetical protein